ncbi:MAG: hypothetical protein OEM49_15290 [Myxococcales bacterium]|nr:hypothetical protein [Myxococcales bacterium]MDH5307205.1 hypothetical protein [Myxococcales bacterium]MDH5567795.1 hypothetical protein [Myxococcales bacterium]
MKHVAIALAAVFLLSGCFVWDELEQGEAILDAHSPNRNKRKKEEEAARAEAEAEKQPSASQRMAEWWDGARSLGPRPDDPPSSDPLVSCQLPGGTRFTKLSECRIRGGRVPKS